MVEVYERSVGDAAERDGETGDRLVPLRRVCGHCAEGFPSDKRPGEFALWYEAWWIFATDGFWYRVSDDVPASEAEDRDGGPGDV